LATKALTSASFGPITDNAGGIVEMSGTEGKVRDATDELDSAGNTTKALTKGYALGSAGLAAFLLFSAYIDKVNDERVAAGAAKLAGVDISKPEVFVAGFLAAMLVFLFSSFAIRAVGNAAGAVIEEVRRQFREHPGIMDGKERPDFARAVDITARAGLRGMVVPGVLAVGVPVAVGLIIRGISPANAAEAVAAFLMVGTIAGILMATFFNNAGGAWDNAKKWIEAGNLKDEKGNKLGKRSEPHKSAVVGDTVGDPFKDTAGPSLHVLVKLLATVTLVLAPIFIVAA
jgi:K(+)-stimulated pyrophosphate-energized sodium pump